MSEPRDISLANQFVFQHMKLHAIVLVKQKKKGRKPIICFKYKTTKTYMGEIYAREG